LRPGTALLDSAASHASSDSSRLAGLNRSKTNIPSACKTETNMLDRDAERLVNCHYSSILMYSRMRCVNSPTFFSTRTRSPFLLPITPCSLNRISILSVSRSLWHCSTSTLSVANWCSFGFAIKASHCCSVSALLTPKRALELLLSLITVKSKFERCQLDPRN